jgi:UDP-2,3-diacylglucosamine hydrolase
MKIVFIADAHLKGLDDPNQKTLASFLDGLDGIDSLVILGDLFDFWTGFGDVAYYHYLPVLGSLLNLRQRGVKIVYVEGNHDFSMGAFFTGVLGADVHPESAALSIDGMTFHLAHGDAVSMTAGYAAWRWLLRSALFRAVVAIIPPRISWRAAMRLSRRSRAYNRNGYAIEARLREFARARIKAGAGAVVLAHSHVAGVYRETAGANTGVYANPGPWAGQGSFLVYSSGEFRVERYVGAGEAAVESTPRKPI